MPDPVKASRMASSAGPEPRIDPLTGRSTWIVPDRQSRPNLPTKNCPFCPGGREAPDPYDVRSFPNRWPPLADGKAEVVLYTPHHDTSFADLSVEDARKVVDLWSDRTDALGAAPDVAYVLVFENRGPEVGATIHHPHGQIYALPTVPDAALVELQGDRLVQGLGPAAPGDRLVATIGQWRAWVPFAAGWPFELVLAPQHPVPDLPTLEPTSRDDLAGLLIDAVGRLDALFDAPMPFMMWIHQRPSDGAAWPTAWLHLHIAPILRNAGVPRFVAAGELGSGSWFNPIDPSRGADLLRRARD